MTGHEVDKCQAYLAMSALPPRADMCGATRDVHFGPKADICHSIDHFIGELLKKQGNVNAERLCCILVDVKLKFRWLLDGQIGRLRSLENFVHLGCAAPVQVSKVCHRAAEKRDELAPPQAPPNAGKSLKRTHNMFFQETLLTTSHNDNNTHDPSSRGVDKHRLAQRHTVPQPDCL